MPGDTPPTSPQTMQHIYCPTCGYNLTGLAEPRCPECGTPFDATTVVTNPVGPWRTTSSLIMLAVGPVAFIVLMIIAIVFNSDATMGVSLLAFLGAGIVSSIIVGRRLARRLARRAPHDPPTPTTVITTLLFGSLLFAAQIGVACMAFFAGCLIVIFSM